MKYAIELGTRFKKSFKRLHKKYHSLDRDFEAFLASISANPTQGADLGGGIRKIRMQISDKGKGKSHGARIITYTTIIDIEEGIITLLAIYDKEEQSTITKKEIQQLLEEL
uniref:Addiction module toxin RelE n=3 Tax=unclassified Prevotella TaxID=2638335 RepID=A0AB33JKH3_9BACT